MTRDAGSGKRERPDVAWITTGLAAVAGLVYLSGALALQVRLGRQGLPSSAAVPQLPREFLIGNGVLLVVPPIGLGVAANWAMRRLVAPAWRYTIAGGIGLLCCLLLGLHVVRISPFPVKVCLNDGHTITGILIGETSDRTYVGSRREITPPHIMSIPQSQIVRVIVGKTSAVETVPCTGGPIQR